MNIRTRVAPIQLPLVTLEIRNQVDFPEYQGGKLVAKVTAKHRAEALANASVHYSDTKYIKVWK